MTMKARFTEEPLWLMDGTAFVFRGFYANQSLTRSDGMPTGAVYIVARILLRILREEQPSHFAFMMDGRGKNFRHTLFTDYKANRSATPEALVAQLEPIKRLVTAMGVHLEVSEACEADDCIASLTSRYSSAMPVVIIGADKDLRQCLNENVVMWDPAGKNEKIITLDSFTAETGLAPDQWPDLQALVGDASDNIPGIPGIGPKTALTILRDHPTLEALRDGFEALPPKLQAKFDGRLDDMFLYRQLTTLRTDCCPALDLRTLERGPVDIAAASAILEEFELPSITRELQSMIRSGMLTSTQGGSVPPLAETAPAGGDQFSLFEAPAGNVQTEQAPQAPVVSSVDDLPECAGCSLALVADGDTLALAQDGKTFLYTGGAEALADRLATAVSVAAPNVKALWRHVPAVRALPESVWFDLGLAAYLLSPEEGDFSWPRLMARHANLPAGASPPAAEQAGIALGLAGDLRTRLSGLHLDQLYTDLELPLIPVLADMEAAGVSLDQEALAAFLREVQEQLAALLKEVHEAAGEALEGFGPFNIRSAQQLGVLLFDRLNLPRSGKTRGGQARTDQETLEKLEGKHPIIAPLLAYRKLEKMRSTYLEPLPRLMDADGRIRTTFNQTATATGRLSSSNPNLQNIPIRGDLGRRMRACFTAAPGMLLISADYSQIELRVLAHLSQEPALLDAFRNGEDIHARTGGLLFDKQAQDVTPDERRNAKTINFGLIYGMGSQSLAKSLGISTQQAKTFIEHYFTHMTRLKAFYENAEQLAREQGYVTTMAGRRRLMPEMHSENTQLRSQARRQAINTVVQGSAADIIKMAMLSVHNDPMLWDLGARLLLQVHDELILEAPADRAEEAAARVAELMAAVRPGGAALDVPLIADAGVGKNWGEAH